MNTADVLRRFWPTPRTGHAYLDAVLERPGAVLAIAHRGGVARRLPGRENTLAAFRLAVELGYTYLETDVHATSDGVLVAFHDEVLDRVTDSAGALASSTWRAVSQARIEGVEPVPRMADLLEELPRARFNIDLKSRRGGPPARRPARAHRGRGPGLRGVLLRAADARVPSGHRRTHRHRGDPAGGRPGQDRPPGRRTPPRWPGRAPGAAPTGTGPRRHPFAGGAGPRAGLHVHVWTVDEPDEMVELLELGVDGLITDRADVLRDLLVERGSWLDL